jgi:hypothetical protein
MVRIQVEMGNRTQAQLKTFKSSTNQAPNPANFGCTYGGLFSIEELVTINITGDFSKY